VLVAIFGGMIDERAIRKRYTAIRDQVDERDRRLFAAAEARAVGRGGIAAVARATGLARSTIERGLKDLDRAPLPVGQVRRAGSGRRPLSARDPSVLDDLRRLIEPVTLGDPMRPLLWVSKSHVKRIRHLLPTLRRFGPRAKMTAERAA
jgi:hypothetical protein